MDDNDDLTFDNEVQQQQQQQQQPAGDSSKPVMPEIPYPPDNATLTDWMRYYALKLVLTAATDPWGFLSTVLIVLTPLFVISAYLSYRLAKDIEQKEKDKKKRERRANNIAKARNKKSD